MTNLPNIEINVPGLTPRQRLMLGSAARILHLGTGTKTGKTFALAVWLVQGIVAGERCCWVGPWFPRVRAAFDIIRSLIEPLIESGEAAVTETTLRIRLRNGGTLDCFSGDNAQAIYGGNYSRVVVDEASRCPSTVWPAVLTTISATGGRARTAFNLELGGKNWAIKNLLRVQSMTPEEREQASEDYLLFPTGGDGLVDPTLIEMLRSQMPEQLWRALYLAEIPSEDVALFRNLDRIFAGSELEAPRQGHMYACGIDLGRKRDYSVVTILDTGTGQVVAGDRFHQLSWSLQVERAAALYRQFRCWKAWVDATGIGDPIAEELGKLGLNVEPFIFTVPSRKALLENLILACDRADISLPASDKFLVYKHEMESFEYQLDGSSVKYAAPAGFHDDCVMSLALAVYGFKQDVFGNLFRFWKETADKVKGTVVTEAATPEEAFRRQSDAQMQSAISSDARVGSMFGQNRKPFAAAKDVVRPSKVATPACPQCGAFLSRRETSRGDKIERCNVCGWENTIAPVSSKRLDGRIENS